MESSRQAYFHGWAKPFLTEIWHSSNIAELCEYVLLIRIEFHQLVILLQLFCLCRYHAVGSQLGYMGRQWSPWNKALIEISNRLCGLNYGIPMQNSLLHIQGGFLSTRITVFWKPMHREFSNFECPAKCSHIWQDYIWSKFTQSAMKIVNWQYIKLYEK